MTKADKQLVKSALRRAFSRSELRKEVVQSTIVSNYSEDARPRVKKWSVCPFCKRHTPTYLIEVDHIDPVIPYGAGLEDVPTFSLINGIFCKKENLQAMCVDCHEGKTAAERDYRRSLKPKVKKEGLSKKRRSSKR